MQTGAADDGAVPMSASMGASTKPATKRRLLGFLDCVDIAGTFSIGHVPV